MATDDNLVFEGTFFKQASDGRNWKPRWVGVYSNGNLVYSTKKGAVPKGALVVRPLCHVSDLPEKPHGVTIHTPTRILHAYPDAVDEDGAREMVAGLKRAISGLVTQRARPPVTGNLHKCGHIMSTWKPRYFVLFGSALWYFDKHLGVQKGLVFLDDASVDLLPASNPETKGRENCIFIHNGPSPNLVIQASSPDEAEHWRKAIQAHIDTNGIEQPEGGAEEAAGAKADAVPSAPTSSPQQESKSEPAAAPSAAAPRAAAPSAAPVAETKQAPAPAPAKAESKAEEKQAPAPAPAAAATQPKAQPAPAAASTPVPVPASEGKTEPAPATTAAPKSARASTAGPSFQALGSGPVSVPELEAAAREALVSGVRANKYSRRGSPKSVILFLDPADDVLQWQSKKNETVPLGHIVQVTRGLESKVLKKHKRKAAERFCVSLYTPTRTLDIEFVFKSLYEVVVKFFEVLARRNNPEGKAPEEVAFEPTAAEAEAAAAGEAGEAGEAGSAEGKDSEEGADEDSDASD